MVGCRGFQTATNLGPSKPQAPLRGAFQNALRPAVRNDSVPETARPLLAASTGMPCPRFDEDPGTNPSLFHHGA